MLAELYVEALLADEKAADAVWERWNAGLLSDDLAATAWQMIYIFDVALEAAVLRSRPKILVR